MNMNDMIKELQELRDATTCTADYCVCERYDRIIDALEAQRNAIWDWLRMVADPKHSDGEGLAKIPQEIPDEYISDGEMLDLAIELLEDKMGLSVDAAAKELSE